MIIKYHVHLFWKYVEMVDFSIFCFENLTETAVNFSNEVAKGVLESLETLQWGFVKALVSCWL